MGEDDLVARFPAPSFAFRELTAAVRRDVGFGEGRRGPPAFFDELGETSFRLRVEAGKPADVPQVAPQ